MPPVTLPCPPVHPAVSDHSPCCGEQVTPPCRPRHRDTVAPTIQCDDRPTPVARTREWARTLVSVLARSRQSPRGEGGLPRTPHGLVVRHAVTWGADGAGAERWPGQWARWRPDPSLLSPHPGWAATRIAMSSNVVRRPDVEIAVSPAIAARTRPLGVSPATLRAIRASGARPGRPRQPLPVSTRCPTVPSSARR